MKWSRYGKEWRATSQKLGPVAITYSRKKGIFPARYYLLTNSWIGPRILLGGFETLAEAKRAAE